MENNTEIKSKLINLVKQIDIGMLSTVENDGSLRSRPMSSNGDISEDGTVWFFTYGNSHKMLEVKGNNHVNVSFVSSKHQYVSLSGQASVVRDRQKIEELWKPQLRAWFPKGIEEPDIALLKVELTKAEYWDSPGNVLAHVISFAKAIATGKPYDGGENKKVTF